MYSKTLLFPNNQILRLTIGKSDPQKLKFENNDHFSSDRKSLFQFLQKMKWLQCSYKFRISPPQNQKSLRAKAYLLFLKMTVLYSSGSKTALQKNRRQENLRVYRLCLWTHTTWLRQQHCSYKLWEMLRAESVEAFDPTRTMEATSWSTEVNKGNLIHGPAIAIGKTARHQRKHWSQFCQKMFMKMISKEMRATNFLEAQNAPLQNDVKEIYLEISEPKIWNRTIELPRGRLRASDHHDNKKRSGSMLQIEKSWSPKQCSSKEEGVRFWYQKWGFRRFWSSLSWPKLCSWLNPTIQKCPKTLNWKL